MKVQTIQRRINRFAFRLLAICGAVLMGVAAGQASAQSTLKNYLSSPAVATADYVAADNAASGVRQVSHEGQAYRVIDSSTVKTAGDLRGPIGSAIAGQRPTRRTRPVRQTSCNSCNSGSCNGGCQSYSAYSMGQYGGGACGTCEPYCYGVVEILGLQRAGDRGVTFSGQAGRLEEFDFEAGARFTIGTLPDCVHGCEATFVGVFNWDRFGRQVDPAGELISVFSEGEFLDVGALRPFNDGAVDQRQVYEAEYWSIEGNKTQVGWDVAKLLFGFRYLEYNEVFGFSSLNLAGEAGRILAAVKNRMAGFQVGLDLLYPIGRYMYSDFRSRAGVYANFAESGVQLANSFQGNVIANFDESVELAGAFEIGGGLRFQLGDMLAVRVGSDMLYMGGIGKAPGQIPTLINPFIGNNVRTKQDVFIYGLSLGAELRY